MKKEMLINDLIEKGWASQENFLGPAYCRELMDEAYQLPMAQAKVGRGADEQEELAIRTDSIYWIIEDKASEWQKNYLLMMDEFKQELNRELFLGLREFECHLARYSESGFYKKHLDQHRGSQKRVVSAILYLNTPTEGGELVIYSKDDPEKIDATIKPQAGSFVCFLSNQIYHEVRPTKGERFSITGWFRTL